MDNAHLASVSATIEASGTDGFQGVNSSSSLPARDSRDIPVIFQRSYAVAPLGLDSDIVESRPRRGGKIEPLGKR
jgi:hypothetical protein